MATPQGSKPERFLILSSVTALSAILISVLQVGFFGFEAPWTGYAGLAISLAAANILFANRFLATRGSSEWWVLFLLYCAQLAVFVVKFSSYDAAPPMRILQTAIGLCYVATALAVLLTVVVRVEPLNATLLSFSLVFAILVCEAVLGLPYFSTKEGSLGPQWVGSMSSHSSLGLIYPSHSVLKTYYPDNPRGYFKTEDPRQARWGLKVEEGNEASVVFPPDDPEVVRIAIARTASESSFGIQLNEPDLQVKANHRYIITLRARADQPRSIFLGFSRAHSPWSGLGLYKKIDLTSEWKSLEEEFTATADDDNSRIHFDAGGSNISVELASVTIRSLPDGGLIEPDQSNKRFFVSYSFNALGCRGRDYTIPRPPTTGRIVLLGDSFTLGVGVHEQDTFGNNLERMLNENAKSSGSYSTYEVVNCGVSGFGTKQERLFYNEFGASYEPNIVLLVMVSNDDMSFLEEVERGYVLRRPDKFESLSYIWGKIQEYRHRRPFPDFRASIDEVLRLNDEVRKQNARLAVAIFRNNSDYLTGYNAEVWDRLNSSVKEGLRGTDIPILDIGQALRERHPGQNLLVHEIDRHPNEIAHKTAAMEIFEFLRNRGLLNHSDALAKP